MARSPTKTLRLRNMEPAAIALDCANRFAQCVGKHSLALEPAFELHSSKRAWRQLQETPIYRDVLALACYAVEGLVFEGTLEELLERVSVLAESSLEEGKLERDPSPTTPLALIIAGAFARQAMVAGEPLGAADVAVLSGMDRDHVTMLAGRGEIPGAYRPNTSARAPWRFRNTAALREWIAAREGEP